MGNLGSWKTLCAAFVLGAASMIAASAQTFTTLMSFDTVTGDRPLLMTLIQAPDRNFYGTATAGGAYGLGTVFRMTPGGGVTSLYSFTGGADGYQPGTGLVQATDGNFYGTTGNGATGYGTVFKITPTGTLTTLYTFNPGPQGFGASTLIQATDGNLYGTTSAGGTVACKFPNSVYLEYCGTIFKITLSGTLTTLYTFSGLDGAIPYGGLLQASSGDFYGTTGVGGSNCAPYGCGTVFRITPGGALTTLHSFNGIDGLWPQAVLVQGADGDFYGTAFLGGAYHGSGQPGFNRYGDGTNGDFYGTTEFGGTNNRGTIFKINPSDGTLTLLHSFAGFTDGDKPRAGLLQATNGNFYGTTTGGSSNAGTVFAMAPSGMEKTLHFVCSQTN
jgi:uncharacterized repeat protein (TIGR03803 family)